MDKSVDIFQALIDSGCDIDFVENFFILQIERDTKGLLESLISHKIELLNQIDEVNQNLKCLDELIYLLILETNIN